MDYTAGILFGVFLEIVWKGGLILLLSGLFLTFFRKLSAASRHALITAAMGLLLALPLLTVLLPPLEVPLFQPEALAEISGFPLDELLASRQELAVGVPDSSVIEDSISSESSRALQVGWQALLGLIWISVLLFFFLKLLVGFSQLWLLWRRSCPVADADWIRLLRACCSRLEITEAPALYISRECGVPFSAGILNRSLFLPAAARSWTREKREVVLLHELAHSRRRDVLVQTLTRLTCALHWVNPLVWLAEKRLKLEAEKACDDLVLEAGAEPSKYARHLLSLARASAAVPVVGAAATRRSNVSERIDSILDSKRTRASMCVRAFPVLIAAFLLLVPVAALSFSSLHETVGEEEKLPPPTPLPPPAPRSPSASVGVRSAPPTPPEPPVLSLPPGPDFSKGKNALVWSNNGVAYRVRLKDVNLAEGSLEISSIGAEGYLIAEIEEGSTTSRIEMRRGTNDGLASLYTVNGETQSWNGVAERLLREVLSGLRDLKGHITDLRSLSTEELSRVRSEVQKARQELLEQQGHFEDDIAKELERVREELKRVQGEELQRLREELRQNAPEIRETIKKSLEAFESEWEEKYIEKMERNLQNLELPDIDEIIADVESSLGLLDDLEVELDIAETLKVLEDLSLEIEEVEKERELVGPDR